MIRDLVVNLPVDSSPDAAGPFAVSVAKSFDAHLTGIAFIHLPHVPGSLLEGAIIDVVRTYREQAKQAAKSAADHFEQSVRGTGVSAESCLIESGLANCAELFGRIARRFDMAIVQQPEPDATEPSRPILEAALFESGRPVLIVPYVQRAGLRLERAMVCWDGSLGAARAIGDAMPFLIRAKDVKVITIAGEPAKSDELPGADIAHHLARHRLNVDLERQVVRDIDVANTILSRAADDDIDIIVMGGYGHSRLREIVMGGATRGILNSMTVPVLMSH